MYIELRQIKTSTSELAADLALHLYARQADEYVYVVAQKPFTLLRIVRKEWLNVTRLVQNERSKTLDARRIAEFSRQIVFMQNLAFSAKPPGQSPVNARVIFIEPAQITSSLPRWHTAYVACEIDKDQESDLLGRGIENGVLVKYQEQ